MNNKSAERVDIYQTVTDTLVKLIEQGAKQGRVMWASKGAGLPKRHTGQSYQGINILLLWARQLDMGYDSPYWMTFRQALELGGNVRKGERGAISVFYGQSHKDDGEGDGVNDESEGETSSGFRFMKYFRVFNACQIEGLPEKFYTKIEAQHCEPRIDEIEKFVKATGANVRHGGGAAFYLPSDDHIQMPHFGVFHNAAFYYATLAHELGHWTRHASRLNRDFGQKKSGDEGYAKEELVAELTAAFLGANFNLPVEHYEDHADYLAHWLKAIKDDKKFIFVAAAKAQQAADYLLSFANTQFQEAA